MSKLTFIETYEKLNCLVESKQDTLRFKNFFIDFGLTDKEADYYVNKFNEFKPRLKSPENDYYYWIGKKDVEAVIKRLEELENIAVAKQQQKAVAEAGADLVAENNIYRVYHITSREAAIKYGLNTKWCITSADPHYWNDYKENKKAEIYYYLPKTGKTEYEKHALVVYPSKKYEIFNTKDDPATGIPDAPQVNGVPQIPTDFEDYKVIADYTVYTLEVAGTNKRIKNRILRFEEALAELRCYIEDLSDAERDNLSITWNYCDRIEHNRWKKAELLAQVYTKLTTQLLHKKSRVFATDRWAEMGLIAALNTR